MAPEEETKPKSQNDPGSSDIPKEEAPKDAEESAASASHTELQSNSPKAEDGALDVEGSQTKEHIKDEDMVPVCENKETDALIISDSAGKDGSTGINFKLCFLLVFIIKRWFTFVYLTEISSMGSTNQKLKFVYVHCLNTNLMFAVEFSLGLGVANTVK